MTIPPYHIIQAFSLKELGEKVSALMKEGVYVPTGGVAIAKDLDGYAAVYAQAMTVINPRAGA